VCIKVLSCMKSPPCSLSPRPQGPTLPTAPVATLKQSKFSLEHLLSMRAWQKISAKGTVLFYQGQQCCWHSPVTKKVCKPSRKPLSNKPSQENFFVLKTGRWQHQLGTQHNHSQTPAPHKGFRQNMVLAAHTWWHSHAGTAHPRCRPVSWSVG
jgi:hypothetical protein